MFLSLYDIHSYPDFIKKTVSTVTMMLVTPLISIESAVDVLPKEMVVVLLFTVIVSIGLSPL